MGWGGGMTVMSVVNNTNICFISNFLPLGAFPQESVFSETEINIEKDIKPH